MDEELREVQKTLAQFVIDNSGWLSERYSDPPPGIKSLEGRLAPTGSASWSMGQWAIKVSPTDATAEIERFRGEYGSVRLILKLRKHEGKYEVVHTEIAEFHGG